MCVLNKSADTERRKIKGKLYFTFKAFCLNEITLSHTFTVFYKCCSMSSGK